MTPTSSLYSSSASASATRTISVSDLPPELLHEILLFYTNSFQGIYRFRLVCLDWKSVGDCTPLWSSCDLSFYCPVKFFMVFTESYQDGKIKEKVQQAGDTFPEFLDPFEKCVSLKLWKFKISITKKASTGASIRLHEAQSLQKWFSFLFVSHHRVWERQIKYRPIYSELRALSETHLPQIQVVFFVSSWICFPIYLYLFNESLGSQERQLFRQRFQLIITVVMMTFYCLTIAVQYTKKYCKAALDSRIIPLNSQDLSINISDHQSFLIRHYLVLLFLVIPPFLVTFSSIFPVSLIMMPLLVAGGIQGFCLSLTWKKNRLLRMNIIMSGTMNSSLDPLDDSSEILTFGQWFSLLLMPCTLASSLFLLSLAIDIPGNSSVLTLYTFLPLLLLFFGTLCRTLSGARIWWQCRKEYFSDWILYTFSSLLLVLNLLETFLGVLFFCLLYERTSTSCRLGMSSLCFNIFLFLELLLNYLGDLLESLRGPRSSY